MLPALRKIPGVPVGEAGLGDSGDPSASERMSPTDKAVDANALETVASLLHALDKETQGPCGERTGSGG